MTLMLSTALVAFFTQYLSPFEGVGRSRPGDELTRELGETVGVSAVLVFNALFVIALLYAIRRWQPPFGFGTLLFGAVALGMAGLEGFALIELVVPAFVAGASTDILIARRWRALAVVCVASFVLWCGFFIAAELSYGLEWSVELWSGTIVLAVASAALLTAIVPEPRMGQLTSPSANRASPVG